MVNKDVSMVSSLSSDTSRGYWDVAFSSVTTEEVRYFELVMNLKSQDQ